MNKDIDDVIYALRSIWAQVGDYGFRAEVVPELARKTDTLITLLKEGNIAGFFRRMSDWVSEADEFDSIMDELFQRLGILTIDELYLILPH